jgi:hypothetical protein
MQIYYKRLKQSNIDPNSKDGSKMISEFSSAVNSKFSGDSASKISDTAVQNSGSISSKIVQ